MTTIGDILTEKKELLGSAEEPEVLTLTEGKGFVSQSSRFGKRLATENTSKYKVIRRHEVAFNPYLLWSGAIAMNLDYDKAIISPLYPTFSVNSDVDPEYAEMLLMSTPMTKLFDQISFGSIPRRRRASVQLFLSLEIPSLPPRNEQRRVSSLLNTAKHQLGTRRFDLREQEKLREIWIERFLQQANQWRTQKLGAVSEVRGGLQVSPARNSYPIELPYLRVANVFRDQLNLTEVKTMRVTEKEATERTLECGDLLIVEGHGNPKELGRCAVWHGNYPPITHQNHIIRARPDGDQVRSSYVNAWLNSRAGRSIMRRFVKTTTGLNTLSVSNINSIDIPIPPMGLQIDLERQLAEFQRMRVAVQHSVDLAQELYDSLQYRAFRGEL